MRLCAVCVVDWLGERWGEAMGWEFGVWRRELRVVRVSVGR